ncbi:site-specific DNA-methyltransferase, partial [Testudinibacter sp. TR-2022]
QQPTANYNIKINGLKRVFPEVFCEGKIDFEKLKLILGEDNLADQGERYHLNWAGKTNAYRTLQAPTFNTLAPCQAESVDFANTQNVFIEAENLEALKILQKSYAGSVKMIYIDPPYNTGNDSFIYPDKFSETKSEYARRVGDTDDDGYLKRDGVFQGAFRKNSKDSGHYHSNWLNMMLPRLHLAKTLLRDDGVIFISIDDNEQAQLKLLCDEVFGAENFVADVIWQRAFSPKNDAKYLSENHDYILIYTKNISQFKIGRLPRTEEANARYTNKDNDPRGNWTSSDLTVKTYSENYDYEITTPVGNKLKPTAGRCWGISKERFEELKADNRIWFGESGERVPRLKRFLSEVQNEMVSTTLWFYQEVGHNQEGRQELKDVFAGRGYFDSPKPTRLLNRILKIANVQTNDLILDFFSGSGTTAHAVMQLNAEDGGNRKYICMQLPEPIDEKSEAKKAGFDNIAEIAKERIRRAGKQISSSLKNGQSVDTGFKVFKLSQSNFKQWQSPVSASPSSDNLVSDSPNAKKQFELDLTAQLAEQQDIIQTHATTQNMAYEIALRLGFQLTDPMTFADNIVWLSHADGSRKTALLLQEYTLDILPDILSANPTKVFALDIIFHGDDALKANTALQCKDSGVSFEVL